MLDKRLVRAINSGRCFILVGSGPSCEVGYPSWHQLAERTYAEIAKMGLVSEAASYDRYLEKKKYPELFRQAELDIGDRSRLVDLIKGLLIPTTRKPAILYELISRWPFACYLTTNFDDELTTNLARTGEYFTVIRNRLEDFFSIRDGVSHIVQKLHSDLNHPDELVLTSADYRRLYVDSSGDYFRDKLRQVLEMFDLVIIGHSLSDPDIDYVLQMARRTASPQHPIYMIAADFSKADEREYLEKYNIVLMQYSNSDGEHGQLRRLLATTDRFIAPRRSRRERAETTARPKEEVEAAASLFLYRRLQDAQGSASISPLVLSALASYGASQIDKDDLLGHPSLKAFRKNGVTIQEAIDVALVDLVGQGLAKHVPPSGYSASERGRRQVQECAAVRDTERDQAYGQFILNLKGAYPALTREQEQECRNLAENLVVASFARRGLTIANQVFAGHSASPDELSDIFGCVSDLATTLSDMYLRAAFVEAMHQFLIEPSSPQKEYLASVSQGYFLYHLLGLDPKCVEVRRQIFEKTLWIFDSSVILPLIALGCHNHDYAVELFGMLRDARAVMCTTSKLLQESWEHFEWAVNFMRRNGAESPEFLRAALGKGSYKQNLFLDGYIGLSADGRTGSFSSYLDQLSIQETRRASLDDLVGQIDVCVLNRSQMSGFSQEDWGDLEATKAIIRDERKRIGTYRSELQIEAEAEVWELVKHIRSGKYRLHDSGFEADRVYFVSQSRVLDRVFQPKSVATWTPEALYRYMSALPGRQTDPELLQQCMLHEYYYAGISFIDRSRYLRFFGPSVDAAKASYEQEKAKYVSEVEGLHVKALDEAFERTPDLEKPFFVAQMGWRLAEASQRREQDASRRAVEAEAKVKALEAEKSRAWKAREAAREEQEAARHRNIQDPAHVRKRMRQAKKRAKKRKK